MELKLIFTIGHLFGVALGAGGAYLSDVMFFSSAKDDKITYTEFRFLTIGSKMVWVGLITLFLSGLGLFLLDMETYLDSSKFLAKVTIVFIIFLNGLVFHFSHLERIKRHKGEHLPSSDEFMRKRPILLASGVASFISWTSALILGAIPSLSYSYGLIMGAYFLVLLVAIFSTLALFKYIK